MTQPISTIHTGASLTFTVYRRRMYGFTSIFLLRIRQTWQQKYAIYNFIQFRLRHQCSVGSSRGSRTLVCIQSGSKHYKSARPTRWRLPVSRCYRPCTPEDRRCPHDSHQTGRTFRHRCGSSVWNCRGDWHTAAGCRHLHEPPVGHWG